MIIYGGKTVPTCETVRDAIYKATMLLDDQKWNDWLSLCDDEFEYSITSWSPEINYNMTYLEAHKEDLRHLIDLLPKHNTDHSPLHRHTTVYSISPSEDGKTATAISSVIIYQNMLDGAHSHIDAGESRLFVIGRYFDTLKMEDGKVSFLKRELKLDNRRLDKGSHWPL
jgi:methanesulfonate monooxygenase small subunit